MGCAASKVDNEDTVRRCKERRRLMKDVVYARHSLAAAHADYIRFLRLTGSALSSFATFEPLSVSDQTPIVFFHSQPSPKPPLYSIPATPPPPQPSPSPPFSPSPTIASSKLPHILSASSSLSDSATSHHLRPIHHARRRKFAPKLPHILSESSPWSSPRSQVSNFTSRFPTATAYQANSNYSDTPSQASSIWNWENFYPHSPPESEFFNQRAHFNQSNNHHGFDLDETETERSEYDFLESNGQKNHHPMPDFTETEREEVQCSDWGDHYSTTTSSSDDENREEDLHKRGSITHMGFGSNFVSSVRTESLAGTDATEAPPPHPEPPKYAACMITRNKEE